MTDHRPTPALEYWATLPIGEGSLAWDVPYRVALAERIAMMTPESVLEFGCGAGANLAAILAQDSRVHVMGLDANPQAVEKGRAHYGFDIRLGDETSLAEMPRAELGLTVSALCHIEDPWPALEALALVTDRQVLVEPRLSSPGLVTRQNADGTDPTPFTWSHDYADWLRSKGGKVNIAKYPLSGSRLGPEYRLFTVTW